MFIWHRSHAMKYLTVCASVGTHVFMAVCVFVASILLAYATYRLYDLPVREWLRKRLFINYSQKDKK